MIFLKKKVLDNAFSIADLAALGVMVTLVGVWPLLMIYPKMIGPEILLPFDILTCLIILSHASSLPKELRSGKINLLLIAISTTPLAVLNSFIPFLQDQADSWLITQAFYFPILARHLHKEFDQKIIRTDIKFTTIFIGALLTIHILGCGWLFFYPPKDDAWTEYNKAIYWVTTTLTTIGYGDITPSTNTGRIFTMGVQIFGATVYGIAIANASRLMLALDRRAEEKKNKLSLLRNFFKHYDVPKITQEHVFQFYHHLLTKKLSDEEHVILKDMPPALQLELQTYMNLKSISQVSLFKGCSRSCLIDASQRLTQEFFAPDQPIIHTGDLGHEMFLIGHGSVAVQVNGQVVATLDSGQCFGEMALISAERRTADVTAKTYCDVFRLSKEQFTILIEAHADLRANVDTIAKSRARQAS